MEQFIERTLAVGGHAHLVPLEGQGALERLSHRWFVIDDKDTHGHQRARSS
ncbi:MAG: hypothetical protein NVS3B21_02750 [Acidimicrobiales bacterium]